jgi:hypothetical protein
MLIYKNYFKNKKITPEDNINYYKKSLKKDIK